MTQSPRISIGMPVYNGESYLAQALDCFLAQTFDDFEILISDNASTDRTGEIAEDYASRDPRVRYFRQDRNIGAGPNHNYLLELSQSPYFKWAAHDDLHEPAYLARCVRVLEENPDVVLAHADSAMIDSQGRPLSYDLFRRRFVDHLGNELVKEPIDVCGSDQPSERFDDVLQRLVWCTAMYGAFRREVAGHATLERSFYGSDKVFLAEMALLGKFHHVKEKLFLKRYHPTMSARMNADERSSFMDTSAPATSPYFMLFKGYLNAALRVGSLDAAQRLRCLKSVARKTATARYWRKDQAA